MHVNLMACTPALIAIQAIRRCWNSEEAGDSYMHNSTVTKVGPKDEALVKRIIGFNHTSTVEHLYYNFEILGMSRAILQELARHRHASLSVQSTRFCLKKLLSKDAKPEDYVVSSGDPDVDALVVGQMERVMALMFAKPHIGNDRLKYALPEAFKTDLQWSVNARSLRNFLVLRLAPKAHFEIQELAAKVALSIPKDHRLFFNDVIALNHGEGEWEDVLSSKLAPV